MVHAFGQTLTGVQQELRSIRASVDDQGVVESLRGVALLNDIPAQATGNLAGGALVAGICFRALSSDKRQRTAAFVLLRVASAGRRTRKMHPQLKI